MRESEQWRKVAELVAEGETWFVALSKAGLLLSVLSGDQRRDYDGGRYGQMYRKPMRDSLYVLLLAEEAEDEERALYVQVGESQPFEPTAITSTTGPFLSADLQWEPAVFTAEPEQDEPTPFGTYPPIVDRRRTWNQQIADGLRKWADRVEGW